MTNKTQVQEKNRINRVAGMMALLLSVLLLPAAQAANTWVGLGGDDYWSTSANWDVAPTFPAALTFGGATRLTPTNDLSGLTVTGIGFATNSGAFNLLGTNITLTGNISVSVGGTTTNDQTVSLPITLGANNVTLTSGNSGGSATDMSKAYNKGTLLLNGRTI